MDPQNEVQQPALVPLSVVVLPLPAQGHLNQLLHLSRHLASRSIPVHYVGTPTHNRQARDRAHGWDPAAVPDVHFHDFPVPPFPAPPPNPNSPVGFPSHLQPAFDAAALHLAPPLSSLLLSLSSASQRVVLIHDSTMGFASRVASSVPNAESFAFHCVSAIALLFFFLEARGRRPPEGTLSFLPSLSFDGCFTEEFESFLRRQHQLAARGEGRLLNTSRAIEAEFVERLELEPSWRGQRVFAIGPINPAGEPARRRGRRHECSEWLDRHPPASVLYVSFGTTSSLPRAQVLELASGLASSGRRFVWALRNADRGDIYAPGGDGKDDDGLEDVVPADCGGGGRGLVVRGWAPQLEILAHPSTGGFLTHCGWNSCMESMSMGVPMLTWPMHSDQPWNALLVTEVLRTGIAARDWSERGEVLSAESISESIARLMESDQGKETAMRARAVKEKLGEAMADGGSSREDFDSFLDYMRR